MSQFTPSLSISHDREKEKTTLVYLHNEVNINFMTINSGIQEILRSLPQQSVRLQ
jgi:hypothetical protein